MAELIDPLDDSTYDHRAVVYSGIKTKPISKAYVRGWERIFGKKIIIKVGIKQYVKVRREM